MSSRLSEIMLDLNPPSCRSSPTCQGVLTLRQIEDLVKGSSFGAVISSSILVPAQTRRRCSTEVAPTPHGLNLIGWTSEIINQQHVTHWQRQQKSPLYKCVHSSLILMITNTYFVSVVVQTCLQEAAVITTPTRWETASLYLNYSSFTSCGYKNTEFVIMMANRYIRRPVPNSSHYDGSHLNLKRSRNTFRTFVGMSHSRKESFS